MKTTSEQKQAPADGGASNPVPLQRLTVVTPEEIAALKAEERKLYKEWGLASADISERVKKATDGISDAVSILFDREDALKAAGEKEAADRSRRIGINIIGALQAFEQEIPELAKEWRAKNAWARKYEELKRSAP